MRDWRDYNDGSVTVLLASNLRLVGDKLGKFGTIVRLHAKDFSMFGYDPEALGES